MQETLKLTLENLDNSLKKLSFFAFGIDKESRIILGIIAKNGSSTETRITKLGNRHLILTRDIIRRRLLITDLSSDFLSTKKGKKIGNLKGKREKFFSLTFKGILASLYKTKLSENYLIKNYISNIEKITNKTIADLFLQHIYHCIIIHLILNSKENGFLTNYKASQSDITNLYYTRGSFYSSVHFENDVKGIPSQFRELFINSVIEFYVLCTAISNLLNDLKIPSKYLSKEKDYEFFKKSDREEMRKSQFMIIFFEGWMYSIFDIIGKTPEKLFKEYPDHDYVIEEPIDFEEILKDTPISKIEELSKKLYLNLNPQGEFDRAHSFLSPRPRSSKLYPEEGIDD